MSMRKKLKATPVENKLRKNRLIWFRHEQRRL